MAGGLTAAELERRLAAFPRLRYAGLPTPLEELGRLSSQLGGPRLWIKRDDGFGPGLGGNKGRALEFFMADLLRKGQRKAVTFGSLQSNHARMTAAACAQVGVEAHLLFFARRPPHPEGNLLLDALFGAKMHFIPFGGGGDGSMTLETNCLVRSSPGCGWGATPTSFPSAGITSRAAWVTWLLRQRSRRRPHRWACRLPARRSLWRPGRGARWPACSPDSTSCALLYASWGWMSKICGKGFRRAWPGWPGRYCTLGEKGGSGQRKSALGGLSPDHGDPVGCELSVGDPSHGAHRKGSLDPVSPESLRRVAGADRPRRIR